MVNHVLLYSWHAGPEACDSGVDPLAPLREHAKRGLHVVVGLQMLILVHHPLYLLHRLVRDLRHGISSPLVAHVYRKKTLQPITVVRSCIGQHSND